MIDINLFDSNEDKLIFTNEKIIFSNTSYTEKNINSIKSEYKITTKFNAKPKLSKKEIIIKTIQTIIDDAKDKLKMENITEINPMAFLLSEYNVNLMKKISSENNFEFKEVYKTIISEVFDRNLHSTLKNSIHFLKEKNN